jgi:hypothetical protein
MPFGGALFFEIWAGSGVGKEDIIITCQSLTILRLMYLKL